MNTISFDDFYNQYELKRNPIEIVSPYENTMLDFGDSELDYIESHPVQNVWSLVEDSNELTITPGIHYKNVFGYFVSKRPWLTEDQKYVLL